MLKLEMKFDEVQIRTERKFTPEAIYDALDRAFSKYQFRKEILSDGTLCYYGNDLPRDYGAFGRLITALKEKEWFMPYLIKWLWYNSDDGEHEHDFAIEDVLYHYAKRESTV